jgi:hypothetical protein
MTPAKAIQELHDTWQRITGQRLLLDCMRERAWFDWLQRGLTVGDLRMLLDNMQARIRAGKLSPTSLKFRYIVGNVDQSEEDVAELKARRRIAAAKPMDRGRAEVMTATGRAEEAKPDDAMSAAELVEKLRLWRKENA